MSIEAMKLALRKAFNLGSTYWQQADSEYTSQWKKADVTLASFNELVETTLATLRTAIEEAEQERSSVKQEPVAFLDWYDNAHWGNEDFKEGCHRAWNAAIKYTTPPAAQDLQTELEATNRQVEILSDALAESRREVAAQRQWVGLPLSEANEIANEVYGPTDVWEVEAIRIDFARAIEAKLKEKNT